MTTTVQISISGNKAVEVKTTDAPAQTVYPGQSVTRLIHGDGVLSVQETGEFLTGQLGWIARPALTPADAAADLAGTPRPDQTSA